VPIVATVFKTRNLKPTKLKQYTDKDRDR